jgi:flagellar biosynthesis protein FlhG
MDQAQGLRRILGLYNKGVQQPHKLARVIAVSSGKGGVGKSSVAVNLGIALIRKGLKVAILDADLGLGNIDILLGLTPKYNLSHVLYGDKTLSEIAIDGPEGILVYPGSNGIQEMANLNQWRLNQFLEAVSNLDEQLDLLIVDTGAGIGQNVLSFLLSVNELVIVTTPEPTAVTDAYAMIKTVLLHNHEVKVRLIVNMVKDNRDAVTVHHNLNMILSRFLPDKFNLSLLGMVSFDRLISKAVIDQVPFIVTHPRSLPSRQIEQIGNTLYGKNNILPPQGVKGLFKRIANQVLQTENDQ